MSEFAHFVITRFNLPLYSEDRNRRPTRTDEWLANRFGIFETYCLPSVEAQTCRNFRWLVLFDRATPERYRQRIEDYGRRCPVFQPVFYDEEQTARLTESLRATIRSMTGAGWVATTNLDNDDALSADAVRRLQAEIADPGAEKTVYSLLYGYQYLAGMRVALRMRYTNNHFLTLAERNDDQLETVVTYHHARVVSHFRTVFIKTGPGMWLEVVHSDNVSNELRINARVRNIPILRGRDFSDFGLTLKVSGPRQFCMSLFVLPFRFLATGFHRLRTKRERMKNPNPLKG